MNSSPGAWRRRSARVVPVADVVAAPEPGAPPDVATRHGDGEALLAELARLPRRAQAVLVLRYYEGLSDAEIAELLGCRPATVRAYASRALATLRVNRAAHQAVRPVDPQIQLS